MNTNANNDSVSNKSESSNSEISPTCLNIPYTYNGIKVQ